MNGLREYWDPRRRWSGIALASISVVALLAIAVLATGCGSAEKSDIGITGVKVIPGNKMLHRGETTIIQVKKNLGFVVGVKNTGNAAGKNVKITFSINQKPQPILEATTIGQIRSGQEIHLYLKGPFNVTELISKLQIKVGVTPGTGETNKANNAATYGVRFSF